MQDRAHTPADNALNALLGRGSEFDGNSKMDSAGSNLVTLNRREGS